MSLIHDFRGGLPRVFRQQTRPAVRVRGSQRRPAVAHEQILQRGACLAAERRRERVGAAAASVFGSLRASRVQQHVVRARLAVEALHGDFWRKYVGLDGDVLGMTTFGASAPGPELMNYFGFSVANVVQRAEALLN